MKETIKKYLNEEEIERFYKVNEQNFVDGIEPENFEKVYQVLVEAEIDKEIFSDIVISYLELFSEDPLKVKSRVEMLREVLGEEDFAKIGEDLSRMELLLNEKKLIEIMVFNLKQAVKDINNIKQLSKLCINLIRNMDVYITKKFKSKGENDRRLLTNHLAKSYQTQFTLSTIYDDFSYLLFGLNKVLEENELVIFNDEKQFLYSKNYMSIESYDQLKYVRYVFANSIELMKTSIKSLQDNKEYDRILEVNDYLNCESFEELMNDYIENSLNCMIEEMDNNDDYWFS